MFLGVFGFYIRVDGEVVVVFSNFGIIYSGGDMSDFFFGIKYVYNLFNVFIC